MIELISWGLLTAIGFLFVLSCGYRDRGIPRYRRSEFARNLNYNTSGLRIGQKYRVHTLQEVLDKKPGTIKMYKGREEGFVEVEDEKTTSS